MVFEMPKAKTTYRLLLLFFACFYALRLQSQNYYQDYCDGHLFVKFKNAPNITSLSAIKNLPAKGLESRLIGLANEFNFIHFAPASSLPDPELQTYYKLVFTQPERTQDLIRALSLLPEVELVEQEPLYKPIHTPNDYRALRANPANIVHWHLDMIKAQEAWDISRGSKDVVIAIIDDAVLTTHEDLRDNIWINPKEIPNNRIDDDRNGYIDDINGWDFIDKDNNPNPPSNRNDFSHGTHVAGIASAVTNNGKGVASIGYNCKIMALKSASDTAKQIRMQNWSEALEYAIRNKANVVNMSFGGSGYSSFFEKLIERATAAGVTVVAAAGNDGVNRIFYPAGYKTVISVGATDWNDAKADFSNYGSWVSVFAPGIVVSTVTSRTQPYDIQGGTSMASPLVAGLCGLLVSYNPRLTPAQIKNCLMSTAVNIESKNPAHLRGLLGAGRIDAVSALRCTDPPVCNADTITTHYAGKSEILQNQFGYPAGTNAMRYRGIAQAFTEQKGVNRLLGVGLELGKIKAGDRTSSLKCVVRSITPSAAPGEIIQAFDIPLASILEHYAKSNDIFYFLFPEPMAAPYAYYLGLEYNFANQDTIALKTTLLPSSQKSTVWVKNSNDQWTSFSAAWGKEIGLGVFPIATHSQGLMDTRFTYQQSAGLTVRFEVALPTPTANIYVWEFEDNSIQTGPIVQKTFEAPGKYKVSLTAANDNCTQRSEQIIEVNKPQSWGRNLAEGGFLLFPNPAQKEFYLRAETPLPREQRYQITVADLTGKILVKGYWNCLDSPTYTQDISRLAPGIYTLTLENQAQEKFVRKFIKE
jgi:hypothetical protein